MTSFLNGPLYKHQPVFCQELIQYPRKQHHPQFCIRANDVFLDVPDIPYIQGGEGGRQAGRGEPGGRGKTGENRRKRAKTRGKRAGNKKGGKGKRKEGKTSLKIVILEGKLSQNRVREGIWEAGGRREGIWMSKPPKAAEKKHH